MTPPNTEIVLWQPDEQTIEKAQMTALARHLEQATGRSLPDYASLHAFSTEEPEAFWTAVWDLAAIVSSARGETVLENSMSMPGARWFPEARLNFAENLLRGEGDADAIVFHSERSGGDAGDPRGERRVLSRDALRERVAECASALRAAGLVAGDRVAGDLPNLPEAVIAMLATASIGAIWSSCSPDFGNEGVIDRFGQIEPKILFVCDGYFYGGKTHSLLERLPEILERIPSIERCIVVPYASESPDLHGLRDSLTLPDFVRAHAGAALEFEAFPFDHPLYVLFSSGTTGKPKCIVHGAGGTLLQHVKEHRFHVDLRETDRIFYFTTCGWMMWNWLVTALASKATLVLYDGSPTFPAPDSLFEMAANERVTVFGTSAKFIDALAKASARPGRDFDLSGIRAVLSTGSPLAPDGFDYVYEHIGSHVQLASISGGTDIVSCFVLGNPTAPVHRGEIQCPGLGMQIEVFDDNGQRVIEEQGELVCTRPFPSMPIGFFGDPDGARYRAAYFERFPGVWCHGDFTLETKHGGYIISGRSDAVLNPGGVRIGTAEIYRQAEALDEVVESIAIGQQWADDVRVVLFVRLREDATLDDALRNRIRSRIRAGATPRHVPAKILEVADIPRTRSGKITELAVREVVHGRPVRNIEALANPEALEHFRERSELADPAH